MSKKRFSFVQVIININIIMSIFLIILSFWHYNQSINMLGISFMLIQMIISIFYVIIITKLNKQANTDMLTGLNNKKYFYEKLSELKNRVLFSLILIDIDNFKTINDRYGHIAGDQVLQQLAYILKDCVSRDCVIARWGGEEFSIILPDTNVQEALEIGNIIRKVIEENDFYFEGISDSITASVGITTLTEGVEIDIDEVFNIADKALYKAKEKKNNVVSIPLHINQYK